MRQRQFGMPTKNVTKKERAEEARSEQSQPETGRYLLQVDRQTKRSFNTPEAAQSAAMETWPQRQTACGVPSRCWDSTGGCLTKYP